MKQAIAYIRVSGLGQVDKDGEARQSESIRNYCQQHGLQYWEQRFEKGVSGTVEGLDRPVFSDVLEVIAQFQGEKPCIVVERLDRLARDLMVQELLLRECRERGIEVYSADQPFLDMASDSGDPTRKLFRQIMGALAEWEKSALVLKLRKARDRKRAATGRCEGQLPYYLRPEGKQIVDAVAKCRDLNLSLRGTVLYLNEAGLKTCNGKPWTKRTLCQFVRKQKGWKE